MPPKVPLISGLYTPYGSASATALRTGKTVGEDTDTTRADETIGFVVFEAGHDTIGEIEFEAFLGADSVQGVDIIYSGRGEKADEVIKRISDRLRDRVVVVTSDKAIETHALKRGSAVIPSADFEMRVRMVCQEDEYGFIDDEEDESLTGGNKKGPARRLSKDERKKQQKLKKL